MILVERNWYSLILASSSCFSVNKKIENKIKKNKNKGMIYNIYNEWNRYGIEDLHNRRIRWFDIELIMHYDKIK